MQKKTQIATFILGAAFLVSPMVWAQKKNNANEGTQKSLGTQQMENKDIDRSDWVSFDEVAKKLKDAGYGETIMLKQTGKGYYARTRDDKGTFQHIYIDPKGEMSLTEQYTKGGRQREPGQQRGQRGTRGQHQQQYHQQHQQQHQQYHQQHQHHQQQQ